MIQDVRIYDHALSAAEVREISQGLVLHYKLDSPYLETTTNLLTEARSYPEETVFTVTHATSTTKYVNAGTIASSVGNNIITYSVYIINNSNTYIYPRIRGMGADGSTWGGWINGNSIAAGTSGWTTVTINMTNTESYDGTSVYVRWQLGTGRNAIDNNPLFYHAQLEIGDHRSPWTLGGTTRQGIAEDSSGYNHNGTIIGTATITPSSRYSYGIAMNNTSTANRIDATSLPAEVATVSLWVKGAKATNQVYFADKNSGLEFGTYSSLGATNLSSKALYNLTNFVNNEWNHIVVIKDSTNNKLYVNGIAATTSSSNNYYTHNGGLYLFNRNANNNYACNGAISDFRAYVTILDADAIRQLYEVGAKVDNKNNVHSFELNEDGKNEITKAGQLKSDLISEFGNMSYLKYDNKIYIEPDGSCWARIYHHNNPGAGSFSSTNDFEHSVYIDENRWFNVELCNYLDKWELMVKGKFTSTSDEWKLRWIQNVNPMTAAYADVAVANITKITTDGYSSSPSSWGGLYAKKSSAYLTANNGNSGNWWGAVGSYSVYQSGIPGWGPTTTVTTTGFNDLYIRIDNVNFSSAVAKISKNNIWTAAEFIEL